VPVERELEDVLILDHIFVVLHWILDRVLEADAMFKTGLNHLNTLIDMIESSRTNAAKPTAGNSMTFQAPTNASTQTTTSNSADQ